MYGKVFESMYDGTLASEGPWQALVTFQQLIVLADQDGVVDMTASAISRRTSIPIDIIKMGLDVLAKPDPDSRTPDEDGRRIVCLESHRDWGWQIVNHTKYQQMRNAAERREYLRLAQAERRARLKAEAVNTCQQSQQLSAKVNASTPKDTYKDADENKEEKRKKRVPRLTVSDLVALGVDENHARDWMEIRRLKKQPLTQTAWDGTIAEAGRAGLSIHAAIKTAAENGWGGFKAAWIKPNERATGRPKTFAEIDAENTAAQIHKMTGGLMGKPKADLNTIDMEAINGTRPLLD